LFVVLSGEGEVRVGEAWRPLRCGDVAFVPRWIFHQTRNTSTTDELVILAITDFGLTSAVLGDYDRRTRLAARGDDVREGR
jgi:quercetin dioxygenase-like cupin family protein